MKILVADDDVISRRILEKTLGMWDYQVIIASDGEEAWQLLQQEDAPRLLILDWMMPGMTGLSICREIRKQAREPYTYILLLTARSDREDVVEGLEAGADDYLTKPCNRHELKVRLRAGTRILELQAELLAAREELREQATRDSLTGVWNRRSILEILAREAMRSSREGVPLGVAMGDLDHFKEVNDTHGHQVGDVVLKEVTDRMVACTRPYDSVGRYGGDEFLVILPGCGKDAITGYAERMRMCVSENPIIAHGTELNLTLSLGVTHDPAGVYETPDNLIRRADEALYVGKRKGGNCVELVEPADLSSVSPTATDLL